VDGLLTVQRHSNENVLVDREDPRLLAGWTHNYESGIFGVTASYAENSSLVNQLISSGAFTQINNTQTTKQLAANWQHTINNRWVALTNAAYTEYSYSVQQATLLDYSVGEVKSKFTYENNEKLKTSIQASYAQLNPDGSTKSTDNADLAVGADYKINEHFEVGGDVGVFNLSGRQSETDWLAGMHAGYNVERMKYSFLINRTIDTSGIGGFQKADALKLGWVYDRTEKDRFGANYSFNKYRKDVTIGLDNVDYQEVSAYFQHDLSSHWQARVNTSYRKLDSIVTNANGTLVGFTITYDQYGF
jgi:outer membrane scaffolding protein for murein synthesis (MipA/OmpV family)